MTNYNYISVFSGAGGLSEGFYREGFLPIAHVEKNTAACFTLKTRIAYRKLLKSGNEDKYNSYLKGEITRDELYGEVDEQLLDSVINAAIGKDNDLIFEEIDKLQGDKSVDIIIGGPPCQAYSVVGRAPLKNKQNDERTMLYIHYGRFLKRYSPKFFVFENVPGILSSGKGKYFKNLSKYYRRIGYELEHIRLNSLDFDVIQNRDRIFIFGWQKSLNKPTFNFPETKTEYRRDDIFSDLPFIRHGETARIQYYRTKVNDYLKDTEIRNGADFVSQHITRPHNDSDLAIYKLAIKKLEDGVRLKNNMIPEGMRTQKNTTDFLDRFKVVGDIPHTMIAHIAKDGHYYIHPDIHQLRSISVREAARIQSFPDDYYFEGVKEEAPRTAAFRQIGNAVPPLMAKEIAMNIKNFLYGQED